MIADVNTEDRGRLCRQEEQAPPLRLARGPERSVCLALVARSCRVAVDRSGRRWCPRRSDSVKHVC